MKKILLVGPNFISEMNGKINIPGGTERYVYGLAKQLQIDNYKVTVLSSTPHKNESGNYKLDGIDVCRFFISNKKFGYLADLLSFLNTIKLVKKFNPDIVHIIAPRYRFSAGALVAAKIFKKKTVYTRTTLPHRGHRNKIPIFVDEFVFVNILKFADVTIVLSREMERCMEKGFLSKMMVIPSFIMESYHGDIEKSQNHILYVGRLDRLKGIDDLIKSIWYVKKEIPNIKLSIVGDGEYLSDLLNLVSDYDLKDNIIFEGHLYDDELVNMYSKSEIFVFPSYLEGMPMAVIEAMSAGLPIIASDIEPCIEILEDGKYGVIVKKGDSKAIANNIVSLLMDDKLKKHYAEMCLKKSKRYTLDYIAQEIENVYEDL
ncbi:glycosyltransferase family 4 protein [Candidatus Pacearchaeota archaeon]|nr:glycosyltransferase family 4 protein [Candidatus Pacearchaeota archaeon]